MEKMRNMGGFDIFVVVMIILILTTGYLAWYYLFKQPEVYIVMADSIPYSTGISFQIKSDKNFFIYQTKDISDFQLYRYDSGAWNEFEIDSNEFVLCSDVAFDRVEECLDPKGLGEEIQPKLVSITEASFYWEALAISDYKLYKCLRDNVNVEEKCALLRYIMPGRYKIEVNYYLDISASEKLTVDREFEVV